MKTDFKKSVKKMYLMFFSLKKWLGGVLMVSEVTLEPWHPGFDSCRLQQFNLLLHNLWCQHLSIEKNYQLYGLGLCQA